MLDETGLESFRAAVELLTEKFAMITFENRISYLDRDNVREVKEGEDDPNEVTLRPYERRAIIILMKRCLENSNIAIEDKDVGKAILAWEKSPDTLLYDGTAFSPIPTKPNRLNLWRGPSIKPVEGDWEPIQYFLRVVLSGSDDKKYQYLLRYLAHAIQRPEEKPEIMIVFYGGQGVGKGTFNTLLRRIWPYTTLGVQNAEEVVGRFSGCMERSYIIFFDEAWFTGSKRTINSLKSKITESWMRIEEKMQPARTINSYHRFVAVANDEHVANTDRDDRRFFVCQISDVRKQDKPCFKQLKAAIQDEKCISAFVHHLTHLDLSDFDVRDRPITSEHLYQKLASLEPIEEFVYEILKEGTFTDFLNVDLTNGDFITSKALLDEYLAFNRNATKHRPMSQTRISQQIPKILPSADPTRKRLSGQNLRGINFPPLSVARREFEEYVGCRDAIEWDDDEENLKTTGANGACGTEPILTRSEPHPELGVEH